MMAVDHNTATTTPKKNKSNDNNNQECPLCLEILDLDDKSFFPCTCGYQICRFCWHRIRSETSDECKGSCPACRKQYSENPANFKPLSVEDVQQKLKQQKRQKDLLKKQKTVDSRRHLADLRVVQKNLVFVVGITPRIADPELLKKNEYFGRFGKIHKIVVNNVASQPASTSTSLTQPTNGQTPPVAYGAYITYLKSDDALRAIQSVNNIPFDGKTIKASLGTTKYCSHFMRNQLCPKPDCMYLHNHGDLEASFTKEDMQMGRHQEYERRLLEEFNLNQQVAAVAQQQEKEIVKNITKEVKIVHEVNKVNGINGHHLEFQEVNQEEENIQQQHLNHIIRHTPERVKTPQENVTSETHEETSESPSELLTETLNTLTLSDPIDELESETFDPFYETQKAFEELIQEEVRHQSSFYNIQNNHHQKLVAPPPGFNNNENPWQQQAFNSESNEWIDPAIIYSSIQQQNSQHNNSLHHQHLLGQQLLNDIFSTRPSVSPVFYGHQNHQITPPLVNLAPQQPTLLDPHNYYYYQQQPPQQQQQQQKMPPPPPGFGQQQQPQQQQFINNNNFFNHFNF